MRTLKNITCFFQGTIAGTFPKSANVFMYTAILFGRDRYMDVTGGNTRTAICFIWTGLIKKSPDSLESGIFFDKRFLNWPACIGWV